MSVSDKLEAQFIGGDYDGKTILIDKAHQNLTLFMEWGSESGKSERQEIATYKLISSGHPLKYELVS